MKKKIEAVKLKRGDVFKRKGKRILYLRDSFVSCVILTGKKRGKVLYDVKNDELVTPVKVKIVEVK